MSRIAYVNGHYVQKREAFVHIEDRGYQFADAVYEVCEVNAGDLIDEARHVARLERSLTELRIKVPMGAKALHFIFHEVIRRNRIENGYIYVQVSRGVAPRDHVFPANPIRPSLIVTGRSIDPRKGEARAREGITVATFPDLRWKRVDIKTTSLTANVLARQAAKEKGAYEAWLVDSEGMVTEGAASNAWIIDSSGKLITHQIDQSILCGITRTTLLEVIKAEALALEERRFSLAEAYAAREAFITGATTLVMPVVRIDSRPVGDGKSGPIAKKLRARFHAFAARS